MSKINVFVRVRPMNETEKKNLVPNLRIQPDSQMHEVRVYNQNNDKAKIFKFNKIFPPNYSQQQIFIQSQANKLVDKVIEGYHSTIFAYGQTGSGKTYSMQGFNYQTIDGVPKICGNIDQSNKNLGIIPRSIRYLFSQIQKDINRSYQISLSYLQIYNQKIYDLLDYDNKQKMQNGLKLRWNKYDQFVVQNIESVSCRNLNEALILYIKGAKNKIMAKHKMNVSSSRSHTILTIKVESFDNEDPKNILSSKLQLVDLAGSEKQSITGSVGKVFKQGIQINKSLFTLRQVISNLFQYNKNLGKNKQKQSDFHIPYRQSKLTSILKQSIGGNNYCVMIACLNPGDIYLQQSLQTLTYASMASYIANVPIRNQDPKIQQIKLLKQQLAQVTEQLHRANEHIKLLSDLANKRIESNQNTKSEISPLKLYQTTKIQNQIQKQQTIKNQDQQINNNKMSVNINRRNSMKPKQFIESINMIKDLLQSNIILRQNIQKLTKAMDKKDSQLYQVMKENQVLRQRREIGGMKVQDHDKLIHLNKLKTLQDRKNVSFYEKLLQQKNGNQPPLALRKIKTTVFQNSEPKRLDISYNELLKKQSSKKSSYKNRKYNLSYI